MPYTRYSMYAVARKNSGKSWAIQILVDPIQRWARMHRTPSRASTPYCYIRLQLACTQMLLLKVTYEEYYIDDDKYNLHQSLTETHLVVLRMHSDL